MGTAPNARQHPAMPDPARTVDRSVRMLMRRPMAKRAAASTVATVAARCMQQLASIGIDSVPWLSQVHAIAVQRVADLTTSDTESTGDPDANRSSSTAGGQDSAKD